MAEGKKVKVTEEIDVEAPVSESVEAEKEEPSEAQPAETAGEKKDAGPVSGGENLAGRIEAAEEQARKNHDLYLRVSAELDNFKKRSAREMESYRKFATEKLVKDLLPVVDNLERALISAEDPSGEGKGLKEGVDLTLREILRVLDRFGVKPIHSLNEPFDPAYHQAMMQETRDNVPGNTVISELQKGYTMHDRLLRPAMVVVSSPPSEQEKGAGETG